MPIIPVTGRGPPLTTKSTSVGGHFCTDPTKDVLCYSVFREAMGRLSLGESAAEVSESLKMGVYVQFWIGCTSPENAFSSFVGEDELAQSYAWGRKRLNGIPLNFCVKDVTLGEKGSLAQSWAKFQPGGLPNMDFDMSAASIRFVKVKLQYPGEEPNGNFLYTHYFPRVLGETRILCDDCHFILLKLTLEENPEVVTLKEKPETALEEKPEMTPETISAWTTEKEPKSPRRLPKQGVLPRCAACYASREGLKKCTGCRKVWYCDTECQKVDRKRHRVDCGFAFRECLKSNELRERAGATLYKVTSVQPNIINTDGRESNVTLRFPAGTADGDFAGVALQVPYLGSIKLRDFRDRVLDVAKRAVAMKALEVRPPEPPATSLGLALYDNGLDADNRDDGNMLMLYSGGVAQVNEERTLSSIAGGLSWVRMSDMRFVVNFEDPIEHG